MLKHLKNRDVLSGLIFVIVGVYVALKAYQDYSIGTLSRMGPGYFPLILGVTLAIIGLVVVALGLNVRGLEVKPEFSARAVAAVLLGALAFAQLVERFGLIPASLALTLIAAAAEKNYRLRRSIVLGLALGILCWTIFVLGLDMNLSAFTWQP